MKQSIFKTNTSPGTPSHVGHMVFWGKRSFPGLDFLLPKLDLYHSPLRKSKLLAWKL